MMTSPRPYNFSAGPAALPEEVLQQAAADMLDWQGCGMSVMEMSHRGREFISIAEAAEADLRELLAVPANYRILFMQGGGLAENAIVPMNLATLAPAKAVDFVVTGTWSKKSAVEAQRYCDARVAASAGPDAQGRSDLPALTAETFRPGLSYVHLCSNETIHGLEWGTLPDLQALGCSAPLVIDCSSHILSRAIDWSKVGLAFAGAQKNIGPAGVTIVIVREDLLGHAQAICPSAFDYRLVAENASMYNTPPTYGIYIAGLVFQWVKRQGGVAEMERRAIAKSQLLYDFIDRSEFYVNRIAPAARSRMNVPFQLVDESRNDAFLAGAKARGLLQLKGHKSVGGMRASIYNAMPLAGVQALVDYLRDFAAEHA